MQSDGPVHDTDESAVWTEPAGFGDGMICHEVPSQVSTSVSYKPASLQYPTAVQSDNETQVTEPNWVHNDPVGFGDDTTCQDCESAPATPGGITTAAMTFRTATAYPPPLRTVGFY